MKILYLHQYFATPESNAGTRSFEMAKRLLANGHNVTFVTSSAFLASSYKLQRGWNVLDIDGIKLHVLHQTYSNKDSYSKRILKFIQFSILSSIKALSVKADVVFATSTPLTIAIPGVIYSKVKKVPMVFEVRDLWPELPIAVGAIKSKVLVTCARALERFAYKNSTRLIGLSPGMCEGIEKQGIPRDIITLATNSCDTDLFDVDVEIGREYKRTKLEFAGNRKVVVYTGTFGIINNVSYIVDLALASKSIAPDVCYVAYGDGMEKQKIIDYAKEKGVYNDNLYIMDPVPKVEVVEILSAADLSLSLFGPVNEMWHNSANKLFDALASQTPIAINYGGWQKEFIDKSHCGVVLDFSDVDKSACLLNKFLNDRGLYQVAKNACHDLSYNHYSRDIMATRLENAIVEAVNG
ncbi:glycosyltransferase family 4 protein [Vibrio breoganii]